MVCSKNRHHTAYQGIYPTLCLTPLGHGMRPTHEDARPLGRGGEECHSDKWLDSQASQRGHGDWPPTCNRRQPECVCQVVPPRTYADCCATPDRASTVRYRRTKIRVSSTGVLVDSAAVGCESSGTPLLRHERRGAALLAQCSPGAARSAHPQSTVVSVSPAH